MIGASEVIRYEFNDGTMVTLRATFGGGRREKRPLTREEWEAKLEEIAAGTITGHANGIFYGRPGEVAVRG